MRKQPKPAWVNLRYTFIPAVMSFMCVLPTTAVGNLDLANAALQRTQAQVTYDGSYRQIGYPGGDVPPHIGVCTDVVIRAFRTLGTDLQVLVHEDMQAHFEQYPALWGLRSPDSNIDHRRVPNLETFLRAMVSLYHYPVARVTSRRGTLCHGVSAGLCHISVL